MMTKPPCRFAKWIENGHSMTHPIVSVVSYLNSYPFVYGLEHSGLIKGFDLIKDTPAFCADRLASGEAIAGLVPVAALALLPNSKLISEFAIAAHGNVRSVLLLSKVPLQKISQIVFDPESLSSNALTRILAVKYWNLEIEWKRVAEVPNPMALPETMIAIGDKAFQLAPAYPFCIDLAAEWYKMTGLPFVFAVWAGNSSLIPQQFNEALEWGIARKEEAIKQYGSAGISVEEAISYLNNNIQYKMNADCYKAMDLFLRLLKEITPE